MIKGRSLLLHFVRDDLSSYRSNGLALKFDRREFTQSFRFIRKIAPPFIETPVKAFLTGIGYGRKMEWFTHGLCINGFGDRFNANLAVRIYCFRTISRNANGLLALLTGGDYQLLRVLVRCEFNCLVSDRHSSI